MPLPTVLGILALTLLSGYLLSEMIGPTRDRSQRAAQTGYGARVREDRSYAGMKLFGLYLLATLLVLVGVILFLIPYCWNGGP